MLHVREIIERERGQSVVILGGALLALMALLALVVDSGNAYVQRRIVQNATDAATFAANSELAMTPVKNKQYYGGPSQEEAIWMAAVRIAEENGIPDTNGSPGDPVNTNIRAYFVDAGGNVIGKELPNNGGVPPGTNGVRVVSNMEFDTFFARLIGFNRMATGANSIGYSSPGSAGGPCSAEGLFPIAVSEELFVGEGSGKNRDGDPVVDGKVYQIFEKDKHSSKGNFGWLRWDDSNQQPSNTQLVDNMNDTSNSGRWHVEDWVPGTTGVKASAGVREALNTRIDDTDPDRPAEVVVPVYNNVQAQGANFKYQIAGFAKFRLLAYDFGGNARYAKDDSLLGSDKNNGKNGNKWIKGEFVQFVDSVAEAGCAYFGGSTVKLHEPIGKSRQIVGTIYANELIPESSTETEVEHVPVEVMLVLDVSGSMDDGWSGAAKKLYSAQDALTSFNSNLQPDKGDHVGLATFPDLESTSQYKPVCWDEWGYSSTWNTAYTGEVQLGLTTDITGTNTVINNLTANGGTPLADGIRQGRQQLLDDHKPGYTPVMIVASDGIANITLDGLWTGFDGNSGTGDDTPACNNQAEKHTKDEANLAKEAGITVFSIAIGDGFNTDVTEAIASPDHDADGDGDVEEHFFVAASDAELQSIYEQLAERMETIGEEDSVRQQQVLAKNATVTLTNVETGSSRTTHTNNVGAFAFEDLEPGVYRINAYVVINGYRYDILTRGYGGEPLDPQYVEVEVGEGSGSTESEVIYLATDDLEY